jgi:hypothetical protein
VQDGCSYFCLGNEHWQLIGIDDSYTDPDNPQLAGSQIEWVRELLAPQQRPGTILLSHHQPFSAWEAVQSALAGQVAQAVGQRRIEAWLWGHEHRAAVYAPGIDYEAYHDLAEYTAIIGHGGVPNLESGPAVTPPDKAVDKRCLRWQNTDYYSVADDTWSYGGYAVIDIHETTAAIQYYTELGEPRTDERNAEAGVCGWRSTNSLLTTSLAGRLQGALDNGDWRRGTLPADLWPVDQLCELGGTEVNQAAVLDGAVLTLGER